MMVGPKAPSGSDPTRAFLGACPLVHSGHGTWAGMSLHSEGRAFPHPELPHLQTPSSHYINKENSAAVGFPQCFRTPVLCPGCLPLSLCPRFLGYLA